MYFDTQHFRCRVHHPNAHETDHSYIYAAVMVQYKATEAAWACSCVCVNIIIFTRRIQSVVLATTHARSRAPNSQGIVESVVGVCDCVGVCARELLLPHHTTPHLYAWKTRAHIRGETGTFISGWSGRSWGEAELCCALRAADMSMLLCICRVCLCTKPTRTELLDICRFDSAVPTFVGH